LEEKHGYTFRTAPSIEKGGRKRTLITMVSAVIIRKASLHLLEPYTIPSECPYLSEDQRELSKLDLEKRAEWMAEWLLLASQTDDANE